MAFKVFAPGVLTSSDVNTFLMRQAVITCTSSTRPASPSEGMTIYETDTDVYRVYDGSDWEFLARYASGDPKPYTPVFSTDGSPNYGAATLTGQYVEVGEMVLANVRIDWAGSVTYPSTAGVKVSLPTSVKVAPVDQMLGVGRMFDSSIAEQYALTAQAITGGEVNLYAHTHNIDAVSVIIRVVDASAVSQGLKAPTDSGDRWVFSIWYQRG